MDRKILALRTILENKKVTQRELALKTASSLGTVNKLLKCLEEEGLLEKDPPGFLLTEKALSLLSPFRTQKAVIMAAGFGSRFVPLTLETPKGLLEVLGEPMIERQIRQLHEAGITDITVIVGYMKERFEYLIDRFGVKLRYNPEFTDKNTLASLYHAADVLEGANCYILSSDNWMRENLYHSYEPAAWYASAHSDGPTSEWVLESDGKGRITATYPGGCDCDYMYGPAYFSKEFSEKFLPVLKAYYAVPGTENFYWEQVLLEYLSGMAQKRFPKGVPGAGKISAKDLSMYVNRQEKDIIYEFENLEELRRFDPKYENDSGSKAMRLVADVFGTEESEITKIRCLKAGMTNNSWLFELKGKSYICRIPGKGTDRLINRRQEADVYKAVEPLGITEEVIYLNPESGVKISRFYENSRNASPESSEDLKECMALLKNVHRSEVTVGHDFDIAERIGFYETLILEESGFASLAEEIRSGKTGPEDPGVKKALSEAVPFKDYLSVRETEKELVQWLKGLTRPKTLCHIDSVPDNFIFAGAEGLKLIDWEYAGMADPLIDISMCAIYSFMDEKALKRLEDFYFGRRTAKEEQEIIYAYVALGGLLWSLWGIYKEKLGVQFTDYTLKMYRYFKDYAFKKAEG